MEQKGVFWRMYLRQTMRPEEMKVEQRPQTPEEMEPEIDVLNL